MAKNQLRVRPESGWRLASRARGSRYRQAGLAEVHRSHLACRARFSRWCGTIPAGQSIARRWCWSSGCALNWRFGNAHGLRPPTEARRRVPSLHTPRQRWLCHRQAGGCQDNSGRWLPIASPELRSVREWRSEPPMDDCGSEWSAAVDPNSGAGSAQHVGRLVVVGHLPPSSRPQPGAYSGNASSLLEACMARTWARVKRPRDSWGIPPLPSTRESSHHAAGPHLAIRAGCRGCLAGVRGLPGPPSSIGSWRPGAAAFHLSQRGRAHWSRSRLSHLRHVGHTA